MNEGFTGLERHEGKSFFGWTIPLRATGSVLGSYYGVARWLLGVPHLTILWSFKSISL